MTRTRSIQPSPSTTGMLQVSPTFKVLQTRLTTRIVDSSHRSSSNTHYYSHGSSMPPDNYNPCISPPYLSRPVDYRSSYPRNTRRRNHQDSVYTPPIHPSNHSSPISTPAAASGRERQIAQWQSSDPQRPLGWTPESHYFNLNPQWSAPGAGMEPPPSPEMRLYMPSPGYNFPHEPPISPPQSDATPSHVSRPHISPASSRSAPSSSPPASRRGSIDHHPTSSSGKKSCSHCHATSTPLWRREPATLKPLCNACGLYLQQRNKHRPQELIDADAAEDLSESEGDTSGPECSHCHTHHTSVWRRSKTGAQLCNACGVYSRLRGRDRPLTLKRNKIKPRTKHDTLR